ncbi:conserved hypothetical protein [Ricinus communis]|uniref:Endonuclease/exonuclease/phosphatase domain-containing protein n=1 Tax=Ricinus communis TaxID=3988 RepID=B9RU69_RICCO|nr:conserved hypothetical protein [Ricinus communis]
MDLGFKGPMSTWTNRQSGSRFIIAQRLDRAFANVHWRILFHRESVFHGDIIGSDHLPLIIQFEGQGPRRMRCFSFEAKWLEREECKEILCEAWWGSLNGSNMFKLSRKLDACRIMVTQWNGRNSCNVKAVINDIKGQLTQIHNAPLIEESKQNET